MGTFVIHESSSIYEFHGTQTTLYFQQIDQKLHLHRKSDVKANMKLMPNVNVKMRCSINQQTGLQLVSDLIHQDLFLNCKRNRFGRCSSRRDSRYLCSVIHSSPGLNLNRTKQFRGLSNTSESTLRCLLEHLNNSRVTKISREFICCDVKSFHENIRRFDR